MLTGIRCMVMRGGTSKGLYFLKSELPADDAARDRFLLRAMGSPDARQIDGMGGADPLTSKVAIVGPATRPDAMSTICSCKWWWTRRGSTPRRIAATSSPASAASRSSAG